MYPETLKCYFFAS